MVIWRNDCSVNWCRSGCRGSIRWILKQTKGFELKTISCPLTSLSLSVQIMTLVGVGGGGEGGGGGRDIISKARKRLRSRGAYKKLPTSV